MADTQKQPLHVPDGPRAVENFRTRSGQYFGDRFPTFEEFRAFLAANPTRIFDENCFYSCSMAVCAGGSVSEGYASDIDRKAPAWFRRFEKACQLKTLSGQDLLAILLKVGSR